MAEMRPRLGFHSLCKKLSLLLRLPVSNEPETFRHDLVTISAGNRGAGLASARLTSWTYARPNRNSPEQPGPPTRHNPHQFQSCRIIVSRTFTAERKVITMSKVHFVGRGGNWLSAVSPAAMSSSMSASTSGLGSAFRAYRRLLMKDEAHSLGLR